MVSWGDVSKFVVITRNIEDAKAGCFLESEGVDK